MPNGPIRPRATVLSSDATKRRILRPVVVILLVAGAAGLVPRALSPAHAASNFEAVAAGEIGRTVIRFEPTVLVPDLFDPGSSSVQALMNSVGESTAFASSAYPGSLAISAPGLIDGVSGGQTDLPEYPAIAQSAHPSKPDHTINAGTIQMTARSRADESLATATDGANRAEARVWVDRLTDVVTARTEVVSAGGDVGAVRISGVHSSAHVTRAPDQEPERTSEFAVGSMSILGQDVKVTADGLAIPGQVVGLGGVDPMNALLEQLAAIDMSVRILEPVETPNGIISAGIEITRSQQVEGQGRLTSITTYGRALAEVSNNPRPAVHLGGIDLGGTAPPATLPGGVGGTTVPSVGPGFVPPPAGPPQDAQPPITGDAADPGTVQTILARGLVADELETYFYPVLVIGAGVLALVFSLFRKMGARPTWTS